MSFTNVLGDTLLQFSRDGVFPDDEAVSAATIETPALPAALQILQNAKDELEAEVRQISRDQPPDVDLWIENAQGIQDDIRQTKSLASEIVREAEAGDQRIEDMKDKEIHVEFLSREALFNDQLLETLKSIKAANELMDEAQQVAAERKLIDAVNILKKAKLAIDAIKIDRTARAKTLLHIRHEDLHSKLHASLIEIWGALVEFNHKEGSLYIRHELDGVGMDLDQAILGLESFNEVESSVQKFSQQLNDVIIRHRTDLHGFPDGHSLASIEVEGECLRLGKQTVDRNVKSLFQDLEVIVKYLSNNLPAEFAKRLTEAIIPSLTDRIEQDWLRTCIPVSLDAMTEYQSLLVCVSDFATMLDGMQIIGSAPFHEWVQGASKNWLVKRRDDAMDCIRNKLACGIGKPKQAIHIEKAMITKDESLQLGLNHQNGNTAQEADEWAAWGSDDDGEVEQPQRSHSPDMGRVQTEAGEDADDDVAQSWGDVWDIDDEPQEPEPAAQTSTTRRPSVKPKEKELSLSEMYTISSIPDHVVETIKRVLEDAGTLSKEENSVLPVAPAAMGLFNLPAFILAMYRSVSPLCYGADEKMYLYTDSIYMADELKGYSTKWFEREDIPARAQKRMKLDADIKTLENFGKRAYIEVMNLHKTVIKDLMGGAQNFLLTHGQDLAPEVEDNAKNVVTHVKRQARIWKPLLPKSAWAQAVGSLANVAATKLVQDVADLDSLSVDAAESTARVIEEITTLDELFVAEGSEMPLTSQYADQWLKLQFLSQVLQSNQNDIRFMWFESDLSLYFSAQEVKDLIQLSFAENAGQKLLIKEILARPFPRE
ncbi:hypothetical protein BP5796_07532 [Coleophoma crateriformis]|uniref:ZW10 C-terminal helical domain-containing protein n=1 Tax=Coleophoma crateriformis TaxID=565419 RepID=A0A3D8RJD9_9HELO|nr:hypothetical protein BP5796_07532 [Coleophoma crateriformis]